ncbi:MAG: hypothetical protein IJX51_03360 [Clostridia bacterium]|nr:hypothetical protein [Clostridia bacterium]
MAERKSGKRLTKKRIEKYKEQYSLEAMEIAGLAQTLIKRRIERAILCEEELDRFMEELLRHAEVSGDKAKSRAIISKFEALKIEDLTKLSSVMKAMNDKDILSSQEDKTEDEKIVQLKFEDLYDE